MRLCTIIGCAALLLMLARAGAAPTICLTVNTVAETTHYPVAAGDLLKIAFSHSIYGSHVEERFHINARNFTSFDVRYSEPRLVEFYGFESATRSGNWWVAQPAPRDLQTIVLRASQDSRLHLNFRHYTFSISDGAVRLSLGSCSRPTDG